MSGPVHALLASDHRRLEALLARALERPEAIDRPSYDEFRAGLLRHVAMEEKVLLAAVRWRSAGVPLAWARRIRADHAAIAALLVLPPSLETVAALRALLEPHDELEERPLGLYETCERILGEDAPAIVERLRTYPPVRVAAYRDGRRIRAHVDHAYQAALRARRAAE